MAKRKDLIREKISKFHELIKDIYPVRKLFYTALMQREEKQEKAI
jgi:hypothetical protein